MDEILRMIGVVFIAVVCLISSVNTTTYARASHFTKEDLEMAVHDAALQTDNDSLGDGKIVIDQKKAEEAFKNCLEKNTGMKEGDYKIIDFVIYDDSNTTFPVTYNSSKTHFTDTFYSPTVLVVLETQSKNYFSGSQNHDIRHVASYTYKVNEAISGPTNDMFDGYVNMGKSGLLWPLPYTTNITSPFSLDRKNPVTGVVEPHLGVDISAADVFNKPVVAVKDGKVDFSGWAGTYGNLVVINHGDGLETRYAHLNSVNVSNGQSVKAGQIIGFVGQTGEATGPHLHFEIRINGQAEDPLNYY